MLGRLRVPIGWRDLLKRTLKEAIADDCLSLAAQLAYYFFLALFPALLFLVAIISFIPVTHLLDTVMAALSRVAPYEVLKLIQDQILMIAHNENGGLLTLGMLGTIWSTSTGMSAIIDTLNHAYGIRESRPWWRVQATALVLTIALAVFIVASTVLVLAGPSIAEKIAGWFYLGPAFTWTWKILQWPVVFALVSLGIAIVYYYAPDAEQDWIWITPGSVVATILWLLISLAFRFYVVHFTSFNATYGAIGGVIVVLLWFYVSALAILAGAELNAEIEHASPYGKDPGEKVAGEKKQIGALAERTWVRQHEEETFKPALSAANCMVDMPPPETSRSLRRHEALAAYGTRASDWILSGLVLAETAVLMFVRLRSRLRRIKNA
jgi:membrane protein